MGEYCAQTDLDVTFLENFDKHDDQNELFLSDDEFFSDLNKDMEELTVDEALPQQDEAVTADVPAAESQNTADKKSGGWIKSLLFYLHDLLYLLAAFVVLSLVVRVVVVSGTSMNDTLKDGDFLLVLSNVFYTEPKQGDVIVASKDGFDNGAPIVKRVIATEGQTVDIDFKAGIVYVDGAALIEPYVRTATTLQEGMSFPLVVDEGCVFVLGDNRNGSKDSRYPGIGLINKHEIIGKVFFLFLPGTNGKDAYGNPNEPRDFSRIGAVN